MVKLKRRCVFVLEFLHVGLETRSEVLSSQVPEHFGDTGSFVIGYSIKKVVHKVDRLNLLPHRVRVGLLVRVQCPGEDLPIEERQNLKIWPNSIEDNELNKLSKTFIQPKVIPKVHSD